MSRHSAVHKSERLAVIRQRGVNSAATERALEECASGRFTASTGRPIKTTFSRSSAVVVFVQPRLIVGHHSRKEAGSLWIGMDRLVID